MSYLGPGSVDKVLLASYVGPREDMTKYFIVEKDTQRHLDKSVLAQTEMWRVTLNHSFVVYILDDPMAGDLDIFWLKFDEVLSHGEPWLNRARSIKM
jgi:hypothetical protein